MRKTVRMALRTPTNLSLPTDLVAELDELAGPRNRSAFVEEAIRARIRRERFRRAIEDTAGAWDAAEHPEFRTPADTAAWVRARRAELTDPGPEGA